MKKNNKFPIEFGNIEASLQYFLSINLPKNFKILDVGCNFGSLIYNLFQNDYKQIYGVDINQKAINIGKEKYKEISDKILLYEGKNLPFKDKYFDIILMFDVLEHIPDIEIFLKKEVKRVLKKNGMFIFQTPNKYTNIPWEILIHKSFSKYKKWHCSLQSYRSLNKLLLKTRFKHITIEKQSILNSHNIKKVKKKFGLFGVIILKIWNKFPIYFSSNFWGQCYK